MKMLAMLFGLFVVVSEFTNCEVPRGYLGLEAESYRMAFRNLKLKVG